MDDVAVLEGTMPAVMSDEVDTEHVVCDCDENTAMCGEDVTNDRWVNATDSNLLCIVCEHLDTLPCEKCGA